MDFLVLQWNILLCHSRSKVWPSVHVYHVFRVSLVLTKVRVLIFLPVSFPLALPSYNKSHIVAVFISTPSGVCLRLDSKPGTAWLLPFWSPFLKASGTSFVLQGRVKPVDLTCEHGRESELQSFKPWFDGRYETAWYWKTYAVLKTVLKTWYCIHGDYRTE